MHDFKRPVEPGSISGIARPSAALKRILSRVEVVRVPAPALLDRVVDDAVAIDTLASLLARTCEEERGPDGLVDMRAVAARVIAVMRQNQR